MVMPSKLTAMLASGRPVLGMAAAGSELAEILASCGLAVEPSDLETFAAGLVALASSGELRTRLGTNARAYAEQKLDEEAVLAQLADDMRTVRRH